MIVPNTARDLKCHVVIIASGLDKTSGTIYAFVSRDSDGYYLKADDTWASGAPAGANVPTATHDAQGIWKKNLTAAVTNALTAGDSVSCRMTDNETPASATVTSDVVEHLVQALPTAAPTAATVADAVWDELSADHVGAGSTSATLSAATAPSAAVVADAVWDEARSGHVSAGSFGEGQASVQGNVTGSVASVTGAVGSVTGAVGSVAGAVGSVTGAVGSVTAPVTVGAIAANAITAASVATDAVAEITAASGGAGSGSELLTVTLLDSLGAAIQGASVYAHNVSGALVGSGATNASGVAVVNPGPGVITVTGRMTGYSIPSTSATVSEGVNQTASLTGTAVSTPAAADPAECTLYATVRSLAGVVQSGVNGTVEIASLPALVSGSYFPGASVSAVSGVDGVISWTVPRGAVVVVGVTGYINSKTVTAPAAASADISSL